MHDTQYETTLMEFCQAAGITDHKTVLRTQHIEVDGRTIGLIPDPAGGGHLSIYIDLGPIYPERDRAIHALMLAANMESRSGAAGALGVHAETGDAVYHLSVPVPLVGEQLASRIAEALAHIVPRFDAIKQTVGA